MGLFKPPQPPQQRRGSVPQSLAAGVPVGSMAGTGDMAGAAAGPGVGALSGSGALAGGGAMHASGAGGFTGSGALAAVSNGAFPLSVHSSGRYLVQPDGTPFLLCADSTWSLLVNIPLSGVSSYFSTLVSQGFTAVMGNAIEHHYTTVKPPKERGGLLPFTQRMDGTAYTGSPNGTANAAGTQGQFAADNYNSPNNQSPDPTFINNSYWLVIEQILDAALASNLLVFIWPSYLGFHAGDEGWMGEMVVWDAVIGAGGFTGQSFADATKSKMWNYGAWLASRWKNYPNIIWMAGGDYGSGGQPFTTPQRAAVVSFIAGMKSVAGQQSTLWGAHWERPCISDDNLVSGITWDINFCYADEAVAELCRRGYNTAAKPSVLGEYNYENGLFGGTAPWRKYTWWGFLGGIAGGFYGHEQLWRFDDGSPGTDWTTLLATQARLDAVRQFALLKSLPWHRLKPSGLGGMISLVTAGGGTASPQSTDYVTAVATPEGDLLLAYIPPAHTGSITVAMTAMAATCRARWFDPTNSAFTAIGMVANTGTHAFTPPGTNSAGDTDFLLVLDVPGGALAGAGDMAGTAMALAAGAGALAGSADIAGSGASTAAAPGALTGSGVLAGAGAAAVQGACSLTGAAALSAAGQELATGIGAMFGLGTLAGVGRAIGAGAGALVGAGDLAAIGTSVAAGAGAITGAGAVAASGSSASPVVGSFSGSATIAGAGAAATAGTGTGSLTGSSGMAGVGAERIAGAGSLAGSGAFVGAGAELIAGHGDLTGSGSFAGTGSALNAGATAGAFSGAAALGAIGAARAAGAATLVGTASIAGVGPQRVTAPPRLSAALAANDQLLATLTTSGVLTGTLQLQGVTVADIIGPILVFQGDTASYLLTVTDDTGAPYDLRLATAIEVRVKPSDGAPDPPTILLSLGAGVTLLDQVASKGKAAVTMGSADTAVAPRAYRLDVVVVAPGLRQHVIAPRDFTIAAVV